MKIYYISAALICLVIGATAAHYAFEARDTALINYIAETASIDCQGRAIVSSGYRDRVKIAPQIRIGSQIDVFILSGTNATVNNTKCEYALDGTFITSHTR